MAKTLLDLKDAIAAFLNRNKTDFVVADKDNLLLSINHAKDFAQRGMDFFLAEAFATVPNVHYQNGGSLANAVLYGTQTAVAVKKVVRPWLDFSTGTGQFPILMMSRRTYADKALRRYYDTTSTRDAESSNTSQRGQPFVFVRVGNQFYVYPGDVSAYNGNATFNVHMDIVTWIADFTSDADTSFLFDYCFDFLMLRSIVELNFFMKEDQRATISAQALAEAWENLKIWNSNIVGGTVDDTTLS